MVNKLYLIFTLFLIGILVAGNIQAEGESDDFGLDGEEEELPIETQRQVDFTRSGFFELIYVSDDNFKYGQYTGLSDEGFRFAGDLDFIHRPGKDDKQSTSFWTLRANDVGLKTGSLEFVFGNQGSYTFTVAFDNFVRMGNDSGTTPFRGQGSDLLYLPTGWVPATNTSGMSLALDPIAVKQEVKRNQLLVEFTKQLGEQWAFTARYDLERKSGEKIMGAAFYFDAANPHSALLPVPVDYDNHEFKMVLDYAASNLQMQLSVLSSKLDNQFDQLTWQNPYAGVFANVVDYPTGPGSLDLPSDTKFQQLRFNGNYRFSPKIKLRVDASQGSSEINDELELSPYTINSHLLVTEPLPISRINDSLDTSHFYVSLLMKPWKRISFNAKYRFEGRENNLPVLPWQYVRGDAADQPDAIRSIYNQPHDIEKDQYTFESTLRTAKGGRLTLGYDFNQEWRTFSSVDETEEDVFRIELKKRFFDKLVTRFEYSYADFAASVYNWSQSYFNTYTVDQINLIPDNQRFSNHPLLRQYHLANHENQKAKVNFNYAINNKWNMAMDYNYTVRDYDETELGLTSTEQQQVNLSTNYVASKDLLAYFWFNYSSNEMEQTGRAFRGGIEKPANEIYPPFPEGSDPARNWDLLETGETQSLGAGIEWSPIPNKLDISIDYTFVNSAIEDSFTVYGAPDLSGEDLPDVTSDLHHLKFTGSYHYSPKLSLKLNYEYYRFDNEDWALDGVEESTMDKVLSLGLTAPNEVINILSLSTMYRF